MQYQLANNYFKAYEEIVGKSNTVVLNDNVADVSGMIAKALTVANALPKESDATTGTGKK